MSVEYLNFDMPLRRLLMFDIISRELIGFLISEELLMFDYKLIGFLI